MAIETIAAALGTAEVIATLHVLEVIPTTGISGRPNVVGTYHEQNAHFTAAIQPPRLLILPM